MFLLLDELVPLSSQNVIQLSHVTRFLNAVTSRGDPQTTLSIAQQQDTSVLTREADTTYSLSSEQPTRSYYSTPSHTYYNQAHVADDQISLSTHEYDSVSEVRCESDNLPGVNTTKVTSGSLPVTQEVNDASTGNSKLLTTDNEEVPNNEDDNEEESTSSSSTQTQITERKLDDLVGCAAGGGESTRD